MIDAQTTQPYSTDCTEGEDVKLPCNHSTISGADYIHWYRQNPNQSPQYIIHGLQNTVTNSMGSLTIASDRKSSTLVLPKLTLRDTAVYYCALRPTVRQMGLHLCSISPVTRRRVGVGRWKAVTKSKSRAIQKESQRAKINEDNKGKRHCG